MKIAITGATGFIGRQVLKSLSKLSSENNYQITVIARNKQRVNEQSNVQVVETKDLFHEPLENLKEILKDVDILIHIAWYAEPGKYLNSPLNLDCLSGTLNLAQAFAETGGSRFVGIGTCFEYDLSKGILTTETPLIPTTLYGACKASTFQILSQLLPNLGVEFLWCRLFYLYGEGEDSRRLVPYLKQKLSAGEVANLTSGKQIRDFLNVEKAGQMIIEKALGQRQGPVNICSGIPITVRQLAEQIADQFSRRDLLNFGARPDNEFDPPCVIGIQ